MGGSIALTIRFTADDIYRGSNWTNNLPEGLCAAPFYIDLDASRAHAKQWLNRILEGRRQDPDLEDMWGGWNKLAPLSYGLVIVDYVTSTLMSGQGYCDLACLYSNGHDLDKEEKYMALEKAGLLTIPSARDFPPSWKSADIKMPFANLRLGDRDKADAEMQRWCEDNFGLSDEERLAWAGWFKDQEE